MIWMILILSLLFSVGDFILIGKIENVIIIGITNHLLLNVTQDQCICEMLTSDGSISALNYFQTNQTCQLFNYNNNSSIVIQFYLNSSFIFINQSSITITTIQSAESTTSSTTTTSSTSLSTSTTTTTSSSTKTTSTTSSTASSTSSSTTSTTTSSSTTTIATTIPWNCTGNLTGVTALLDLVNVSSQSYTNYSYTYTALTSSTRLTLSFRMDSNSWSLDSVSAMKMGTITELLDNGSFQLGNLTSWSLCNPYNATNSGSVQANSSNAKSGTYYYQDGSKGAADYLYCYFPTVIGSKYTISFYLKSDGGLPNSAHIYIGS